LVDDALSAVADAWAAAREVATLLVPVDSARGLTREHVDRAVRWRVPLAAADRRMRDDGEDW
jgi:hypothetical protein